MGDIGWWVCCCVGVVFDHHVVWGEGVRDIVVAGIEVYHRLWVCGGCCVDGCMLFSVMRQGWGDWLQWWEVGAGWFWCAWVLVGCWWLCYGCGGRVVW